MRIGFLIILTLFLRTPIYSIDTPSEPTLPSIPTLIESPKEKKGKKQIFINLKLCDGREISGKTEYTKEELVFQHEREGIRYTKKININQIKHFYILTFTPKSIKKSKEGTTVQFDPSEIEISSKEGDSFKIYSLTNSDFQKFTLNNVNGSTTLYTYWIDLQYESGKWYSKLPPFKTSFREDCHPDVVRMIKFEPET